VSPASNQRFPRQRRLKRQRLIRPLFKRDRADVRQLRSGPVVIRYRLVTPASVGVDTSLQTAFAVGRAIGDRPARNRVKRIMRETFRLHQEDLVQSMSNRPEVLTMMILFRGRFEGASRAIRSALPEAMSHLLAQLHEISPGADESS
jgi:ribonuclease P protein component